MWYAIRSDISACLTRSATFSKTRTSTATTRQTSSTFMPARSGLTPDTVSASTSSLLTYPQCSVGPYRQAGCARCRTSQAQPIAASASFVPCQPPRSVERFSRGGSAVASTWRLPSRAAHTSPRICSGSNCKSLVRPSSNRTPASARAPKSPSGQVCDTCTRGTTTTGFPWRTSLDLLRPRPQPRPCPFPPDRTSSHPSG